MAAKEINCKASFSSKLAGLAVSYVLFLVIYNFCGWYTSNLENVKSFVFNFEHSIPFLSWTIIPYMSSGLFFVIIFFICTYQYELILLVKRINFITIISGVCFILFPLKYSYTKPDVDSPFFNFFFQFLHTWDTNYNQAPSLHIGYACIFWSVLRKNLHGGWKVIAGIWILLMGLSTLTVYQHHFIDIITALLLICITFLIFPDRENRNSRIGIIYFLFSVIFIFVSLFIYQYISIYGLIILWISIALFLVGIAYIHSDARFLKRKDGTISIPNKMIYFPYLLTYRIIRLLFCRNNKRPVTEIYPQIFVGAMLNLSQVQTFGIDKKTFVIDLTSEAEENKIIRLNSAYYSCPMLDIGTATKEDIQNTSDLITTLYTNLKPDERIYIHCLMGYSRSIFIVTMLVKKILDIDMAEAIDFIQNKCLYAIFPEYLLNSLPDSVLKN